MKIHQAATKSESKAMLDMCSDKDEPPFGHAQPARLCNRARKRSAPDIRANRKPARGAGAAEARRVGEVIRF